MWNSCAKFKRLKKALEYRGLNPSSLNLDNVSEVLRRRGITDKVQNSIVWGLLNVLEPPECKMTHCKNYGNQGDFCYCSMNKVPGKCPIYRAFLKRKHERNKK